MTALTGVIGQGDGLATGVGLDDDVAYFVSLVNLTSRGNLKNAAP